MNMHSLGASISLICLIILNLLWEIFYNPLQEDGSLMPLSGILKKNLYTYQWSSMLILLFFIEGVVRFYSEDELSQMMALFQIILSIIFFISTIFFCKITKQK